MPREYSRWTAAEMIRLQDMLLEGRSIEDIAETLGRTTASVLHKRGRAKSYKRKPRVKKQEEIVAHASLCWHCVNGYVTKCDWVKSFAPVHAKMVDGIVKECDRFVREEDQ